MNRNEVNKVLKEDWNELVGVWEASVRATHHFLAPADIEYYKKLIAEQYLHELDLFCIKNEAGRMTAFMGLSEDTLEMLFVHPDFIGTGLGKKLIRHALDIYRISRVDVNAENTEAFNFYKRMGFTVSGRSEYDSAGKNYPIIHMEY